METRFNKGLVLKKALKEFNPVIMGNIVLPTEVNREDYIKTCQRTGRVSVYVGSNGAVIHNCLVVDQIFQDLEFPQTTEELGSLVLIVTESYSGWPIIINTLPYGNQTKGYQEHVHRYNYVGDGGVITYEINEKQGTFTLDLGGTGLSRVIINAKNSENTAEINLNSNGNINIVANKDLNLTTFSHINKQVIDVEEESQVSEIDTPTEKTISVGTEDEKTTHTTNSTDYTIETETVNIKAGTEINLGDGTQPIPLGDNLKSILQTIISNINTLKTATSTALGTPGTAAVGGVPGTCSMSAAVAPFNSSTSAITSSSPSLDNLNSELSFTD